MILLIKGLTLCLSVSPFVFLFEDLRYDLTADPDNSNA